MPALIENPRIEPTAPRAAARPVRVCFLIDRLSRAGTESQLLALVRELDRSRVEPSLVLLDGDDALSRELEPADCPMLRLGVKRLIGRGAVRAARQLAAFWREQAVEVLQVYFLDSTYFGVPLAKGCGIRRVVRVRNNLGYWLTPRHRWLNRIIGRLVDATLTNTTAGRDALIDAEGLSPNRVAVIPNGVDLERFADIPPPFDGRTVTVGCVANLRPVKNIDGLMRAGRQVIDRHPQVRFVVAGDGEQRGELERLKAVLGLGDRFELRGSVTDVSAFLGSVDVAVLPSHSEGMSNALLEYMAASRPLVATAVGANAELIRDGIDGFVVPARNELELADAIARLIENPSRAQRMGRSARERVESEFSRDAMRQRFEDYYLRLAQ